MNPINLVKEGSTTVIAIACSKCGLVYRLNEKQLADSCCDLRCYKCGSKTDRGYSLCQACIKKQDKENEIKTFEKAKKIDLDQYKDDYVNGGNFGYDDYIHVSDIEDRIEELIFDGFVKDPNMPVYAFAVRKRYMPRIDAHDLVSNELYDYHEDAIEDVDIDGLQELLDKWVDGQSMESLIADESVIVILDIVYEKVKKEMEDEKRKNSKKTA